MHKERPDCIRKLSTLQNFYNFLEKEGVEDDAYAAVKLINEQLFGVFPEDDWFICRARLRDFIKRES
jgi:hypothetical protein